MRSFRGEVAEHSAAPRCPRSRGSPPQSRPCSGSWNGARAAARNGRMRLSALRVILETYLLTFEEESHVNSVDISAVAHIQRHADVHADLIAVVYEDQEVTYADLRDRAGRFASGLRADGVGPGDRVAYVGHN